MKTKCPICNKRGEVVSVEYTKNRGIIVCTRCIEDIGKEGVISLVKQMATVSFHDLERLELIPKHKSVIG